MSNIGIFSLTLVKINNMEANLKLKKVMKEKGVSPQDLNRAMKWDKCHVYYVLKTDLFSRPRKIAEALGVELKDIAE